VPTTAFEVTVEGHVRVQGDGASLVDALVEALDDAAVTDPFVFTDEAAGRLRVDVVVDAVSAREAEAAGLGVVTAALRRSGVAAQVSVGRVVAVPVPA
jgi:hypothetical protein